MRLTSQYSHRHQGRIPWSISQGWNEGCRAASPFLWAPYWAEVFVRGTNSQPLATSDICLSHGGCQKIIAVTVKLQIILHNASLITMKAVAGFEFYSFFLFFLPLLLKAAASPRQRSVLRSVWLGPISLLHFAIWQKGSAGTLGQEDDPTAKQSYEKGSCLEQQQEGKQFSPSFSWKARGREAQKPEVICPCLHSQVAKKDFALEFLEPWGVTHPATHPGIPQVPVGWCCHPAELT